jgi:hypothetical protein
MDEVDGALGVSVQKHGGGVGWSQILGIEHHRSISCAPLETAVYNQVYICWGKVNEVSEELEPLD